MNSPFWQSAEVADGDTRYVPLSRKGLSHLLPDHSAISFQRGFHGLQDLLWALLYEWTTAGCAASPFVLERRRLGEVREFTLFIGRFVHSQRSYESLGTKVAKRPDWRKGAHVRVCCLRLEREKMRSELSPSRKLDVQSPNGYGVCSRSKK
jgi:hypothetical protein